MHFRLLFVSVIVLVSCSHGNSPDSSDKDTASKFMGFTTLTPEESGILFTNTIQESDSFNLFNYEYIYNGGGVAAGDINNDGLTDLYFTGNQVSDKLYLNKGNFKFEDITEKAIGEKADEGWRTGVVMADINNDGWLDIYVCRSGLPANKNLLSNLLYINNGDLSFTERSQEYGVDVRKNSTQAAFFDYDQDGDLDLYVMNHLYNQFNLSGGASANPDFNTVQAAYDQFTDVLLRNDNGKFTDVTKEAGIYNYAFGLGLAITDFDKDGDEDIYVSNDYSAPDFLYVNQGNGKFVNEIWQRTGHISNYSMGNDAADFNNDEWPDIMCLDMVSEDHARSKKNMGGMNPDKFWQSVRNGFHYQYMFNTLQLNNGNGTFSEIAQLAGISKTDWSWAPLFADFDNDGLQDLFITNGYKRDARDLDATARIKQNQTQKTDYKAALDLLPATRIANYMFQNLGNLKFQNRATSWKLDQPVNSNGVAYADLDNDGDLDLITNNMDEVASVLRNDLKSDNSYLRVKLQGDSQNKLGLGTKIRLVAGDLVQYREFQIERGFQSSVEPIIHFGLGTKHKVDQLEITWPDGKSQTIKNVSVNQILTVSYSEAKPITKDQSADKAILFSEVESPIRFQHREAAYDDFKREILLPHAMSQFGPLMSKGDVNGDGLEDLYISGSVGMSGALFVQQRSGSFTEQTGPWKKETAREELGSVFFDADGDGDQDIYVVSGSNEYDYNHELMQHQLYINNGQAGFNNETKTRLPEIETSGLRVSAGDFDGDGDSDLFVGGRQVPGKYPFSPRSYLLRNDKGVFIDITSESPDLMSPGMITQSLFSDFDSDQDLDLICVGEWMPISLYENNKGVFTNVSADFGLTQTDGWWMSIAAGDFNEDGKPDYVLGNIGENNKFKPAKDHPLEIYCSDFDANGTYDIVLGKYQNGQCFPVRGRQCSSQQMPFIQQKFPTYNDFAQADLNQIYGKDQLQAALHFSAFEFRSMILISNQNGFDLMPLPVHAQFGPLNSSIVSDFNNDGHLDILSAGNMFGAEVETMRYDGGRGVLLLGDGKAAFNPMSPWGSGICLRGDVKDLCQIGSYIFVANNRGVLQSIKLNDMN